MKITPLEENFYLEDKYDDVRRNRNNHMAIIPRRYRSPPVADFNRSSSSDVPHHFVDYPESPVFAHKSAILARRIFGSSECKNESSDDDRCTSEAPLAWRKIEVHEDRGIIRFMWILILGVLAFAVADISFSVGKAVGAWNSPLFTFIDKIVAILSF